MTAYDGDYLRKAGKINGRIWLYRSPKRHHTMGCICHSGPKSRDVLNEVINDGESSTVYPIKGFHGFLRENQLGMCPINAIRVAYTGELGWELHHPIEMQIIFDLLKEAGRTV